MKTAISIPDPVFDAAESFAQHRGLSRSELYATAVREYIESHQRQDITDKLNGVYADNAIDSSLDSELNKMQHQSLSQDDW
ncbi:MAG: metal-responsive CopG/Arc/MetJ family transcriptional regulator [Alteromonadaceae bacterium]|jgi:metal-responsive CopG/Arc/MetJ family transcriptional regulator